MRTSTLLSAVAILAVAPVLYGCGKPPALEPDAGGGGAGGAGGGGAGDTDAGHPTVDPNTKGMGVLGAGTDVFGPYAVEANVKGAVLDVAALNAAGLLVYSPGVQESRYEEAQGSTVSEYASSIATSLGLSGGYMFFSAEIKAAYAQDTYRKRGYSYASILERHWKHALKVEPGLWTSPTRLQPYLTVLARQAINDSDPTRTWSGADVIAAYGTHVMNGIYVGGRLDYHLTVQILEAQYQASLMAYARASFKATFASAELTSTLDAATQAAMDSYNRVTTTSAKGGAAQYANPANDADYQLWKASLETNPVFCGIINGGLLAIWELADTEARREELYQAYLAYAATQDASFIPLGKKITGIKVIDNGHTSVVTPEPGFELLRKTDGTTAGSSVNAEIWKDTERAHYVYLTYKADITSAHTGLSDLHLSSSVPAVVDGFYGGTGGQGHDALYGASQPGCLANATVDLNAGTCGRARIWEEYSWQCAIYNYKASCDAASTPLFLHTAPETEQAEPIECVVVGDVVAVDSNQSLETRAGHIFFGPRDPNQDGAEDENDATWVLQHVRWVRTVGGAPINLNQGTQSYHRWDYSSYCGGYDDGHIHDQNAPEDAQYLGYCLP